jgi:hypothetical protein
VAACMSDDDDEFSRRKVVVPGKHVELTMVVRDNAGNMVLAFPTDEDKWAVVFVSKKPRAMLMTEKQVNRFMRRIRDSYQAFHDDVAIKAMEKQFDD